MVGRPGPTEIPIIVVQRHRQRLSQFQLVIALPMPPLASSFFTSTRSHQSLDARPFIATIETGKPGHGGLGKPCLQQRWQREDHSLWLNRVLKNCRDSTEIPRSNRVNVIGSIYPSFTLVILPLCLHLKRRISGLQRATEV